MGARVTLEGSLARPAGGLLFDFGDVLYDATVWRRWLLQLLSHLGLYPSYRSFYHIWDHDFLDDVHRGQRDFSEAFRSFLLSVGLSRAQIDEVEAACRARRRRWEVTSRLLPGVKSTLRRLHAAGITMGVLDNSEHTADVLRQRLERFGVADVFSAVVSSIDLGRTKPDPACYRAAIQAMKTSVDVVAFVGHDAEELSGAASVGMQTIAFNSAPGAQADVFITRFDELFDLVQSQRSYHAAG